MDIYVGNLSFSTTEPELEEAFAAHGAVDRVKIISDRETGRSRGFAFVTMKDNDAANAAIEALNETEFMGRNLRVREAEDRRQQRGGDRGGRGGYGGGRGGRGGYGGGGDRGGRGGYGGGDRGGYGGGDRGGDRGGYGGGDRGGYGGGGDRY